MAGVWSHGAQIANRLLSRFGCELVRSSNSVSLQAALARIHGMGMRFATVIDVGASDGRWSQRVQRWFPDASYLLIEAQAVHEPRLRAYKARAGNVDYVLAAAADARGQVFFNASDAAGGLASHTTANGCTEQVPATTVDFEVQTRNLPSPFLVKLDTHGFEVPILRGAERTLTHTAAICVETYNFALCEGCLRFPETCSFLEDRGFLPIGLVSPLFRRRDGVLWQMDLIFARADREELQRAKYA
ncbi:MAG: FkbM family methyltransferase [Phycisphaerales bacterium]|jgi:FkbM family methyltransferase